MNIKRIAQDVLDGGRVDREAALALYLEADTSRLGQLADAIRARKHPDRVVSYIIDRNVNYTNVCVARCHFCAFYRPVGHSEGYVLSFDELFEKIDETIAVGGEQLLLQGGHNPDLPLAWYVDLFRAVKSRYPTFKLHALSPPEVLHISRLSRLPVDDVIAQLIDAGLDSIPGGGAEILVDRARKLLNCYTKASADEWLDVMRRAHRAGLRSTATMMYGSVETVEERIEHLFRLRELQDETGGFTAFITWSYQPQHTELGGVEATGVEYLRTLAVARIVLDNFDNLQASWVTQGGKVGQLSLAFGANDMGSRDDRGKRRPRRRRRLLHGRSRDRDQHRERRLHRQAPQHALRHPRRSDLPRTVRAAALRPRHREGRGRTARAGRARAIRGQEPGRSQRAGGRFTRVVRPVTANERPVPPPVAESHVTAAYSARWIVPVDDAPHRRRHRRDGWRCHSGRRAGGGCAGAHDVAGP